MRFHSFVFAAILAATPTFAIAAETPKVEPPGEIGRLSITFDDVLKSQLNVFETLKKLKLPGTLYITTSYVVPATTDGADTQSWEEIATWQEIGWEYGSHTITNPNFADTPLETSKFELAGSAAVIAKNTGSYPTTFVSPYGSYKYDVVVASAPFYSGHVVTVEAGPDLIPWAGFNRNSTDPYMVSRLAIHRDIAPEWVCDQIAWAAKEKRWLVLGYTHIVPEPSMGEDGYYQVSVENFEKIAQCAADYRKQKTLEVVTVSEGLQSLGPSAINPPPAPQVAEAVETEQE